MPYHIQGDGGHSAPGGTAYHVTETVTAGTRTRETVAEVGEGRTFIATELCVATAQDPGGDLEVALFSGEEQVTPEQSKATMMTDEIDIPAAAEYDVGDEIDVELDALSRSADIDVAVTVSGQVVRSGDSA
jgi:hypothetical protein